MYQPGYSHLAEPWHLDSDDSGIDTGRTYQCTSPGYSHSAEPWHLDSGSDDARSVRWIGDGRWEMVECGE